MEAARAEALVVAGEIEGPASARRRVRSAAASDADPLRGDVDQPGIGERLDDSRCFGREAVAAVRTATGANASASHGVGGGGKARRGRAIGGAPRRPSLGAISS